MSFSVLGFRSDIRIELQAPVDKCMHTHQISVTAFVSRELTTAKKKNSNKQNKHDKQMHIFSFCAVTIPNDHSSVIKYFQMINAH